VQVGFPLFLSVGPVECTAGTRMGRIVPVLFQMERTCHTDSLMPANHQPSS
jgi:hypothetical protein